MNKSYNARAHPLLYSSNLLSGDILVGLLKLSRGNVSIIWMINTNAMAP